METSRDCEAPRKEYRKLVGYRDPGPIASFALRPARPPRAVSGRWLWPALLLLLAFVVLFRRIPSPAQLLIIALLVGLFLLPVFHAKKTQRHAERLQRAGALDLFTTHLEVPGPDGRLLRFSLEALRVRVDHNEVQLNFIKIAETDLLVLSDGDQELQLSHRLFGGVEQLHAALTAIEAQQRELQRQLREGERG